MADAKTGSKNISGCRHNGKKSYVRLPFSGQAFQQCHWKSEFQLASQNTVGSVIHLHSLTLELKGHAR